MEQQYKPVYIGMENWRKVIKLFILRDMDEEFIQHFLDNPGYGFDRLVPAGEQEPDPSLDNEAQYA
jgi:hypothetical protein